MHSVYIETSCLYGNHSPHIYHQSANYVHPTAPRLDNQSSLNFWIMTGIMFVHPTARSGPYGVGDEICRDRCDKTIFLSYIFPIKPSSTCVCTYVFNIVPSDIALILTFSGKCFAPCTRFSSSSSLSLFAL